MHRLALASAALAALYTSTASPADAQPVPCGPSHALTSRLATEYGEIPTVGGVDAAGRLLVIYANASTGTWTAVVVAAEGASCVVSSGEGWTAEPVAAPLPGRPS